MAAGEHKPGDILPSFLLRSLAVAGYAPSFDGCARCGVVGPHAFFHPAAGGILCSDCRLPGSARPSDDTVRHLGALLAGEWAVVDAADDRNRREARGIVTAYLTWHLERGLRSLPIAE